VNAAQALASGVRQLRLDLPPQAQEKLLAYMELLQKWNKVYNLTAIRQPEQMVSYHLLDSLAALPYLWGGRWLDAGCGAGVPGLALAIAQPQWQFTLLDSNSKKAGFVQQAVIELELHNVTVCCARIENWRVYEKFDGIISRAFASVADFISMTRHLLASKGRWVAMKGEPSQEELRQLPEGTKIEQVIPLKVPGLDAARCLVILKAN
jgi:16S rRNA (guanine527-N7)-methyltransferase